MNLQRRLCARLLQGAGWRLEVSMPAAASYVLVVAPHTSNWDFVVGYLAKVAAGLELRFMAKHTLFRGPWGWWLRRAGGIAVDRGAAHGVVAQMIAAFGPRQDLILVITPEGTRARTEYWKPGFYHIAQGAGVPIALGYIDYAHRRVGIGDVLTPSGDIAADMRRIRDFYADKHGRHRQRQGEVRLRGEPDSAIAPRDNATPD